MTNEALETKKLVPQGGSSPVVCPSSAHLPRRQPRLDLLKERHRDERIFAKRKVLEEAFRARMAGNLKSRL